MRLRSLSKMDKINAAVIGAGSMGKNHARVYSDIENVNLVAICDINEESSKDLAANFNANYYKDYKEMFNNEKIDAVSICVPTKLHKQVAIDAINNGINLLIEKPIAATTQEGNEIIKAAEKMG